MMDTKILRLRVVGLESLSDKDLADRIDGLQRENARLTKAQTENDLRFRAAIAVWNDRRTGGAE